MGSWVDRLAVSWLEASLGAAMISSCVAVAMVGCRQPARRLVLARGAILSCLFLWPLIGLAPLPRIPLIAVFREFSLLSHPLLPNWQAGPRPAADASPIERGTRVSHPSTTQRRSHIPTLVVTTYVVCVSFGLAGLLIGHAGLYCLTRRSTEPSPPAMATYASLPYPAGRRKPRLRIATRIRRPVLIGLFRQTVLIPVELEWPEAEAQLRLTLLHELVHAERRDPWFGLASSLAQTLWFFLPPLWWIRAQMRLDQEFLADHRAAGGFGPPQVYASSLLNLAAPGAATRKASPVAKTNASRSASPLFMRVLMLVRCPFAIESRAPRPWAVGATSLVALATVLTASVSLRDSKAVGSIADESTASEQRKFQMARLVVHPEIHNVQGRVPLFELPIRLPAQFDLSVDVWGDPDSLYVTRVAGHRLSRAPSKVGPKSPEQWHRVQFRRDRSGQSLRVDGRNVPLDPKVATTTWLSVESAPGRPGLFQNLLLTW